MTYEETNKVSLQEAKNVVGIVIQAHLPLNTLSVVIQSTQAKFK